MTTNLGDPTHPDDAIVNSGEGATASFDPSTWLLATLRNEWNSQNTDNRTPNIIFGEDHYNVDFADDDWIVVWPMPETSDPVTITYSFTNDTLPLQIDVYTKRGRLHMRRVIAELRRILENNKTDSIDAPGDGQITGRTWLTWNGVNPYGKTSKEHHRNLIDCEIRWRMRVTT